MRTRVFFLGACLVSCTSVPTPKTAASAGPAARNSPVTAAATSLAAAVPLSPSREYAGVYISTPEEDYFTPCGVEGAGDNLTLRFRDEDPHAPFLKKVTALRGYPPLTHFIRVLGRPGITGSYNFGFQTQELVVDRVLDVKESLEPCAGFGAPAGWNQMPARFRNSKGIALSNDRRLAALMDIDGRINLWSIETGKLLRKLGSVAKGDVYAASYGPMAFSDDDKMLAVGGNEGVVRVWRTRDGKRVFSLKLKDRAAFAREVAKIPPRPEYGGWKQPLPPNSYTPARQLVFNHSGTMLATTNLFSSIIWSMKTGKKLAELNVGNDSRRRVFFVGNSILVTADSGRTTLRDLEAQPRKVLSTHAAESEYVVMAPDGGTIAVSSWGDSVSLWSFATGARQVLHVPGFITGVMAFSPRGNTIAIAGGSSGLYVFDTRTGAPITSFHNFPGPLSGAWFTADGKAIITVSTFDDRFRIVYVDPSARPASQPIHDDSLTKQIPLGPPPSTAPRTIGGIVTGPNQRAVAGAEVAISNGEAPDSIISRATTSPGGYFSFNGIRFRHVVIRVLKPGFASGVKYIHVNRWADEGPWGIELKPDSLSAPSTAGSH